MSDYELREIISECHTKRYIDDRIHTWGKQAELKVWQECRVTINELINTLNENPERSIEELINEEINKNEASLDGTLRNRTLKLVKEYLIKKRYLRSD